jgi:hypothetical protein
MREGIAGPHGASTAPTSEALEGLVRQKAQQFIQRILEEVTELLGQEKSERRVVDAPAGYRNGHGKPRRGRRLILLHTS